MYIVLDVEWAWYGDDAPNDLEIGTLILRSDDLNYDRHTTEATWINLTLIQNVAKEFNLMVIFGHEWKTNLLVINGDEADLALLKLQYNECAYIAPSYVKKLVKKYIRKYDLHENLNIPLYLQTEEFEIK